MGRKSKAASGAPEGGASGGGGSGGGRQAAGIAASNAYDSTFSGALPGFSHLMPGIVASMDPKHAGAAQESVAMDQEVQELCDHFNIEDVHSRRLVDLMRKRKKSFDADLAKLWEVLELARSPAGMLVIKMREMEKGEFVGKTKPDGDLAALVRRYKLDEEASSKLAEVLVLRKESREDDIRQIEKHLAISNRPSAMAMMLLPKLREGGPLEDPRQTPASGSQPGSDRDRDRDRRGGGDRERERRDDRDRDRDYNRGGPRDRDRDRGDRDRGDRDRGDRDKGDRDRDRRRSRSRERR